jgi:lactate dehydrogenase-like 2-hydroxyacid dehydrogenase
MNGAVLVTKRIYPEAVDYLQAHFDTVDYAGTDDGLSADELLARSRGKRAIVSQLTDKLPGAVIDQLDGSVRVIANVAVGYDNIDIAAASTRGIIVTNTPDVLTETTADFAWALLMAAARRVVEGHAFVHSGAWRQWTIDLIGGEDIHHKTIGIVGMGRIGQAVARRAGGFSMRIVYHDSQRASRDVEDRLGLEFMEKEQLLRESDFVSLHVPLVDSTRHLIGDRELALMKPSGILVNTARGPVVNEAALVRALKAGTIRAAGLDVFEREPQVDPGLMTLSNVVLAPHIASASHDTRRKMSMMAAENAVAAAAGRRPANPVNRQAGQR